MKKVNKSLGGVLIGLVAVLVIAVVAVAIIAINANKYIAGMNASDIPSHVELEANKYGTITAVAVQKGASVDTGAPLVFIG